MAHYFGHIDLGHKSRNQCFRRVAQQISRHPGGTLPDKLSNPADYAAMDRLMNRPEATHESVLQPHRQRTLEKMLACPGVVLVLHDTTVLDYSGKKALGLAKVGNGHGSGYLCHNSLAVDPERREVFGLVSQILHQRVPAPRREGVKRKRERKSRESRLWSRAVRACPEAPAGKLWVDVCDRGADLFEFLATEQSLGRRAWCVRRTTAVFASGTTATVPRRCCMLICGRCQAWATSERGRFLTASWRRSGRPRCGCAMPRSRFCRRTCARASTNSGRSRRGRCVCGKKSPPATGTKLEWFLVCLDPVTNAAEAWEKSDWYACRWIEEEYHKAKKTGCHIEDLQFRTEAALQPMIALLSVTAMLLLNLRQAARQPDAQERKASEVVEPIYEEVLRGWRHKKPHAELRVYEFYMAVARLGGHMNRKADGFPGWLTLWRGWQKLESMVAGVEIDRRRTKENRVER